MAPKRNVKITTPEKVVDANPEKPPRGRRKKAQPIKVPSLITISIPSNKAGLDVPDAEKKLDKSTKIALANEVARAQILKEPIAARVIPPTPKRTRGRKKEVVSEFFNTSAVKEEPVEETVPPPDLVPTTPPVVKKYNRKTPVKNSQAPKVPRKRLADPTVKEPRIKRQRITPKSVTSKEDKESTEETRQDDSTKADTTEPLAPKVQSKLPKKNNENASDVNSNVFNPPAASSPKKRFLRGKRTITSPGEKIQTAVEANSTEASGPIPPVSKPDDNTPLGVEPPNVTVTGTKSNAKRTKLSKRQSSCIKSSAKEADTIKVNNPLDSRKNSISSTSNMSWTRDISSSSTTTFLTVASNDFFCIDKKIPLLKLVNIDSEVDNYKPKPLEEDSTSDSSSSSSDSESSSDEQSSEINIGSNTPVQVNSLNLSSSSCKSVLTTIESRNIDKKDYNKAAENLMQALKKIDMEFKNWIHDADTITSDLDRIKDSLFDILSNEFYAITHCRNLQEILNTDVSNSNNIINEPKVTEKVINSNAVERNPKRVINRFKKTAECNTFEKRRTRSSKSDVNTVVESNLETSKKVVSDRAKRNTAESDTTKSKTVENDLIKSNTIKSKTIENELIKSNTVEVDPVRSSAVKSDANKNKIVDNNPVNSNNVKNNHNNVNNKSDDNAENSNQIESNSTNNIENSTTKINRIENKPVDPIKTNPVEKSPNNSKKVENRPANNRQENSNFKTNRLDKNTGSSNRIENNSSISNGIDNNHTKSRGENRTEDELLKPSTSGFGSNKFNNSLTRRRSRVSESSDSSSNRDMNAEHDDDDLLSLYAESITGIESSKINTSIISAPVEKQLEEYIPKPIKKSFLPPQNYSYCPTRITDQIKNGVVKTICEKQNADSTSIYKESNSLPPEETEETGSIPDSVESNQEIIEKPDPSHSEMNIPNHIQKIILMAEVYKLRPKESNIIFRGYCFFNIINKCLPMYSKPCRYSHVIPDNQVIINKLSGLTNDVLIKEYMLIRRNDIVMRRYGILVLFQCVHRGLTRIVVEIAYDFIVRHARGVHIDETLKTAAVEIVLLHLNNVDLSVCEDLLFLVVPDGSLLCEEFMHVMTSTQNFSRFKSVFLSLTYFMVNNDRTFSLEVAEQILERVCILPFDEPLIRALIQIIRLTKPEIFLNSMIENFEELISVNNDVLDQYQSIKSEVNFEKLARKVAEQRPVGQAMEQPMLVQPMEPVLAQGLVRPPLAQTVDAAMNIRPEMREGVPLPPSPDTTHLDNMNKTAEDLTPKITRTIRGSSFTPNTQAVSPSSSNSEEIIKPLNYNNWRNRSIFQQINRPNYPHGRPMRPPLRMRPPGRGMRKGYNHRLVTFGGSPTVYPPPGPDI